MTNHVFNNNDPRINNRADRQRNPAECHDIDRLPGECESKTADQNCQHNRGDDDQRWQESSQEDQYHDGDQNRSETNLGVQIAHGQTNVAGLIRNQRHFRRFRDVTTFLHPGDFGGNAFIDAINAVDRVFARFSQQRAVHAALAVDSNDVVLQSCIIHDSTHIAHENGSSITHDNRNCFNVFGCG